MTIKNVACFVVYKASEANYRHVADLEYPLDQNGQMSPDDLAEVQAYDQDEDKIVYALNAAAMDNLYPLQFNLSEEIASKGCSKRSILRWRSSGRIPKAS